MVMIEVVTCLLIFSLLGAGSYYAALRWVDLRHNRNVLADEYKRATEHIEELEARVMMLEAERDTQLQMMERKRGSPDGYAVFGIRDRG